MTVARVYFLLVVLIPIICGQQHESSTAIHVYPRPMNCSIYMNSFDCLTTLRCKWNEELVRCFNKDDHGSHGVVAPVAPILVGLLVPLLVLSTAFAFGVRFMRSRPYRSYKSYLPRSLLLAASFLLLSGAVVDICGSTYDEITASFLGTFGLFVSVVEYDHAAHTASHFAAHSKELLLKFRCNELPWVGALIIFVMASVGTSVRIAYVPQPAGPSLNVLGDVFSVLASCFAAGLAFRFTNLVIPKITSDRTVMLQVLCVTELVTAFGLGVASLVSGFRHRAFLQLLMHLLFDVLLATLSFTLYCLSRSIEHDRERDERNRKTEMKDLNIVINL